MGISPAFALGFVIASLYGLLFYIMFGRGWLRLLIYWLVGLVGFALGQWLGSSIGLALFNIGSVNFVEGTVVCWFSLFAVSALRR